MAVLAALCLSYASAGELSLSLHAIQGRGPASPYEGKRVRVTDVIVTAVGERGYFVQQPEPRTDGDPETSEGLYVFGRVPPGLEPGERVSVTGRVIEFHGHTQLTETGEVRRQGRGPLPPAVKLDRGHDGAWESLESMRVFVRQGLVVAPSDRHGEVRVSADGHRPVRLAETPEVQPLLEMDPDALGGDFGLLVSPRPFSAEGVLVYRHGDYSLWPTELRLGVAPELPRAVRSGREGELVVASFNLHYLFDHRRAADEPRTEEAVYRRRLDKLETWFEKILQCPDVVAVQEVEVPSVLENLAAETDCGYRALFARGTGNLALGYLIGRDAKPVHGVRALGVDERLEDGTALFDRAPLLLELRTPAGELVLVNLHLRSMRGLGDDPRVAVKRRAQAEALADIAGDLLDDHDGRVLLIGDFNALPFNDGYVDIMGRIAAGDGGQRLLPVWSRLPKEERYSYLYRGHAQMLDHAMAGPALDAWIRHVEFARGNADAPYAAADDPATALGASDHDPLVIYLETSSSPIRSPSRTGSPGSNASRHVARSRSNSRITVEPMLNRPISVPRSRLTCSGPNCQWAGRRRWP